MSADIPPTSKSLRRKVALTLYWTFNPSSILKRPAPHPRDSDGDSFYFISYWKAAGTSTRCSFT